MQIPPKDIKKISYIDAYYSYSKILEDIPRDKIISFGRIISENQKYEVFELAWTENPHTTLFGLVLPKGCIYDHNLSLNKIQKKFSIGDKIALYWNDIFTYDDKYIGEKTPTPMLTEGEFILEKGGNIFIQNPETLNLRNVVNHPQKKPEFYCIPISIIDDIKIIKENDKK